MSHSANASDLAKRSAQLIRDIQRGRDAGFTIDGPRGPRYVAKQGPVHVALRASPAALSSKPLDPGAPPGSIETPNHRIQLSPFQW